MFEEVARHALYGLGAGLVLAFGLWYFLSARRRVLRAIDLASYLIALVALGSGLFSVSHYEANVYAALDRLKISDAVRAGNFDIVEGYLIACRDVKHSPFRTTGTRLIECNQLRDAIVRSQFYDSRNPMVLQSQDIPQFVIPPLKHIRDQMFANIERSNERIREYRTKSEASDFDFNQLLFLELAVPLLAFSLGLGITRRALDLYSDWSRE
jgi:hypothetical protein